MTHLFLAPDGDQEPTIWATDPDHPDRPRAVLRRCEVRGWEATWDALVEHIERGCAVSEQSVESDRTVYERFIAEVEGLTIKADMPAVAVVGELTRAVKRAQNAWDEDDGEANPAMCACGHGLHVHDPEADPYLCELCGDNTRCDYADSEAIAADRWDEGYIAAVNDLRPPTLTETERLTWALIRMPKDNPYRVTRPAGGES